MVNVLNITGGRKKYKVLKNWIVQGYRRVPGTGVNGAQILTHSFFQRRVLWTGKKFFTIRVREAVDAPSLEMLAPPLATLDGASSNLV